MIKVLTGTLTGPALDWAVDQIEGHYAKYVAHRGVMGNPALPYSRWVVYHEWHPSTSGDQAAVIIEREAISLAAPSPVHDNWTGLTWCNASKQDGPTPLIAAMRCFVASKVGAYTEIPEEFA